MCCAYVEYRKIDHIVKLNNFARVVFLYPFIITVRAPYYWKEGDSMGHRDDVLMDFFECNIVYFYTKKERILIS